MLPDKLADSRATGLLSFFGYFLAILVLFVLLSNFVPVVDELVGWFWLAFFLFLFFVLEPLYRRFTDRFEYHVLVLEFYLFSVYLVHLFFPELDYVHLFYLIPIFSAALSFGLLGTMLTAFAAFLLETVRVSPPWAFELEALQPILPSILPLFILALLLGFTVELKNYTQRQLLNRLSKMDTFQALRRVVDTSGELFPFARELLQTVVKISEVSGGMFIENKEESIVAAVDLSEEEKEQLLKARREELDSYRRREIYRIRLPWAEKSYEMLLWGSRLQGILKRAEREMIQALAIYLEHFVDNLRIQHEKERAYRLREALIEAVPLGIVVTDSRGVVVEMNRHAGELLGLTAADLVGRRFGKVFNFVEEEIDLAEVRCETELVVERIDCETIPIDLSITEAEFGPGQAGQWIVVFSDLRPLKKLQEQAERRRRLLALGEFAAGMAHEIRNPLGSLSGFISLLQQKVEALPGGTDVEELIEKIRNSYNRVDELVENFLLYARKPEIEVEKIDLEKFIESWVADISPPEGVRLETDFSELDGFVTANRSRFRTALDNLLRNAVEAAGSEGTVRVEAHSSGKEALIVVEDDGEGFDQQLLERAFEPFVSDKEDGLGLGLAIVHRIISEEMEGELELSSPAGEGTRVTIRLPLQPQD